MTIKLPEGAEEKARDLAILSVADRAARPWVEHGMLEAMRWALSQNDVVKQVSDYLKNRDEALSLEDSDENERLITAQDITTIVRKHYERTHG